MGEVLVFWLNNGKHGHETHCNKMSTDSLVENSPNAPEFICPRAVCPSPKVLDFNEKMLHWASEVRGLNNIRLTFFSCQLTQGYGRNTRLNHIS